MKPVECLYTTEDGEVWLRNPDSPSGMDWSWLRMEYFDSGPTFERGYPKPLQPVSPLAPTGYQLPLWDSLDN